MCELVDYPEDLMTAALTQKSVETRGDRVTVALNTADVSVTVDCSVGNLDFFDYDRICTVQ